MVSTLTADSTTPKTADKDLSIIIRAICFFWFIARIKSHKVWMLDERLFPSIPVFDFLDGFPPIILEALYYITMSSLLFLIFKPNKTAIQVVLFFSVFIAAIFEMTAWQPWEYQYLCMIAVIIINRKNPKALYTLLILIMASIYFYSGMQKFNGGFLHSVWKGLILKKFLGIQDVNLLVHYSGLSLALLEAFTGLALLLFKNKRTPAYILIGMHFFILVLLGSTQGFNIVLPWNVAMIVILHCLFIKDNKEFVPLHLFSRRNILIFILWVIMPATSFLGYWEQKFSSNLFSGRYKNLAICLENSPPKELENFILSDTRYTVCNNMSRVSVSNWGIKELSILPPTSNWYYSKFKKNFEYKYPMLKGDFFTFIYPYKTFKEIN